MNDSSESNGRSDLDAAAEIIRDIERETAVGNFIFRGEPKKFEYPVSSTLYRRYADDIKSEYFDISRAQDDLLQWARAYEDNAESDFELLTRLQHYGGNTNLIDFTIDYQIALFFACDGFLNEDGKIYILNRDSDIAEYIEKPRFPRNRVIAQKSIFVREPNGIIEPDLYSSVTIPADQKQPLLDRLQRRHGISS